MPTDTRTEEEKKQDKEKGNRAEEVAQWYFRLNGFMSIPGFVVHPDQPRNFARTDADLLGVRFPFSSEILDNKNMGSGLWSNVGNCSTILLSLELCGISVM